MFRAEIIAGAVFAALSAVAVFVLIPGFVPQKAEFGPTPAFFPTVSAILIGVSAVGMIAYRFSRRKTLSMATPSPLKLHNFVFLLSIGGVLFLALFGMSWLGFLPASAALIAVLMLRMGNRDWRAIAATAVGTPLVIYGVFSWGFTIPLP